MMNIAGENRDYYKILNILCDNILNIDGRRLVVISQNEVIQISGICEESVRSIFEQLKEDDMIVFEEKYCGRYFLTDKAIKITNKRRTFC